jgi:hypothetical protein
MNLSSRGCPFSVLGFAPAGWSGPRAPADFGTGTYPGRRPLGSFVLADGAIRGVDPTSGGWKDRDNGARLDLAGRVLVLAYGSNADPVKLAKKFPSGTVFGLRCLVIGYSAVWCNARRAEGSVVATIAPDPGRLEVHHILAFTRQQLVKVDRWEGRPDYYERTAFDGTVVLENEMLAVGVEVYVGTSIKRPTLRRDGQPWRLADYPYAKVDREVAR